MILHAHSSNSCGSRQSLVSHLTQTSETAGQFASHSRPGIEDLARLAGLWHDVGKAAPLWQQRLLDCEAGKRSKIGVDHKCAGALLAEQAGLWQVGFLIHAHHGGLRNPHTDYRPWLQHNRQLPGPLQAIDACAALMPDLRLAGSGLACFSGSQLDTELALRMAYSALVDADSLDTEAHYLPQMPPRGGPSIGALCLQHQQFLDALPPLADTPINEVRSEVLRHCIDAAAHQPGVFRLTVPTGGGKTRSALAFGLRHAVAHGLRRLITAVPYTTVTSQTADVYREVLGTDRAVLEHHSAAYDNLPTTEADDPRFDKASVWRRLAAENWDAPVVVTTTVQLFESLFANSRSKTRKLHNLARSVIIIDEAQSLPAGLLAPILDAIKQLVTHYGTSVVLCTATQPAFEMIPQFAQIDAREIIPDAAQHYRTLSRVTYEWRTAQRSSWAEVAAWMREAHQVLVIVNTKRHALELLDTCDDPNVLHLSTRMCGAHRSDVLDRIKARLESGQRCQVVSTQVVEAGVDLDFEAVYRAEAPLDSVIQAAGRCNREGRLGPQGGKVTVFCPPDDASPQGVYASGRDIARVVQADPGFDPDDPQTADRYFRLLYDGYIDPDRHKIQASRQRLDYPATARDFHMIEQDTRDVVVPYPAGSDNTGTLVEALTTRQRPPRGVIRELQPFVVSIHSTEYDRLRQRGFISDIEALPRLGVWHGHYDPVRGIVEADRELVI